MCRVKLEAWEKEAIKNWPGSHSHICKLCDQHFVCWNPYRMTKTSCEMDCDPFCCICMKRESSI